MAVISSFIDMTGDIPFHSVALEEGMGAEALARLLWHVLLGMDCYIIFS